MAQAVIYSTAPLAGRPPFATDYPDSYYEQRQTEHTRRIRQSPPPDPNARTSAYNMYVSSYMLGTRVAVGALRIDKATLACR